MPQHRNTSPQRPPLSVDRFGPFLFALPWLLGLAALIAALAK